MRRPTFGAAVLAGTLAGAAAAEDYRLKLAHTGLRDYYCQITVTLENASDAPLTEINGHFYSYVGSENVGRSKGAWFMNVAPGETAAATFETPNVPCDEVDRYEFVLGACRIGPQFEDKSACLKRLGVTAPIDLRADG